MPLDHQQVFPHQPVAAVLAWGVYADYDGQAPDTDTVVLLSDPALASEVRQIVEDSYDHLCVVDGYEWAKVWRVTECVGKADDVVRSVAEALEVLGDPDEGDENDGDED